MAIPTIYNNTQERKMAPLIVGTFFRNKHQDTFYIVSMIDSRLYFINIQSGSIYTDRDIDDWDDAELRANGFELLDVEEITLS